MNKPNFRIIPYTKPSIGHLEVEYATDAAQNGWGERCYEYIIRFEEEFKQHLGVKFAIATSSCTGAIHMGMHALGIGTGDEVIMADTNWVASAAPIIHLGAMPIFVDILPDSWCLDPEQVEAAITPRTKAILAVHLYGNLCNMNALMLIGEKFGIPVIEDAAEAIGSVFHGKPAGSIGRFGVFSFHGTKTITTGEGGMFVTNDSCLYNHVLTLSNHGRASGDPKQFWPSMVGFKYKMSNIQAAIGCGQIHQLNELIAEKRRIFLAYKSRLINLPIRMNPEPFGCINGFWMPTFVVDSHISADVSQLLNLFKKSGVDARVFFWPLSSTSISGKKAWNRPFLSESICRRALNLPSFCTMTNDDIDFVTSLVSSFLLSHG